MKQALVFILSLLLVGVAVMPAAAAPLGVVADDGGVFFYGGTSLQLGYDGFGYGFGGGINLGQGTAVFVELGQGSFAAGAICASAVNLAAAVKYEHAAGYIDTGYGWTYIEIDGFTLGAYYILRGQGLFKGPYAGKNVDLFGAGMVAATDGYTWAAALYLEAQSLFYVSENAALWSAVALTSGAVVTTLGVTVVF